VGQVAKKRGTAEVGKKGKNVGSRARKMPGVHANGEKSAVAGDIYRKTKYKSIEAEKRELEGRPLERTEEKKNKKAGLLLS